MRQASGEWRRGLAGWLLAALGLLAVGAAFAAGLNDTGQTTCYDDTGTVSPEPSTPSPAGLHGGAGRGGGGWGIAQDRRGQQGVRLHQDRQQRQHVAGQRHKLELRA